MASRGAFRLDDLFFLALRKEQLAEEYYHNMAGRAHTKSLRRLLLGMSAQEKGHSLKLLKLYGRFNRILDETHIHFAREAPLLASLVKERLPGRRAIGLWGAHSEARLFDDAIDAEEKAVIFYKNLKNLFGPDYVDIFDFLIAEEKMHRDRLLRWKPRLCVPEDSEDSCRCCRG